MKILIPLLLTCSIVACKCSKTSRSDSSSDSSNSKDAIQIQIAYGSEKKTWMEEQIGKFIANSPKTQSGKVIKIEANAMGSGEAAKAIVSGQLKPVVYSPASNAYIAMLNSNWTADTGRADPIAVAGQPLVLSPIVIAMWKPMAEALGWPDRPLGWKDLLKVNADSKGWGAYGHPEWGSFKLGHTQPEFSSSGLLAVLAEAYAGIGKTRALTASDLEAEQTQKFIASVEETIVHYGKSTGFFANKMLSRGPSYLSASVLYENLVVESYGHSSSQSLVAIYPVEGTFWTDHPYCILDAGWVSAEQREAAESFLAFLKAKPAQQRALELGFRPSDPSIALTAPIDSDHGVDPKQPQTLLEVPDAVVLQKLLSVWAKNKKGTDLIFVFDKSGSMNGKPLEQAKAGARAFFEALHDTDQATLIFFDDQVYPPVGPFRIGEGKNRSQLLSRLDGVVDGGGTALFDATAQAYAFALKRAHEDPKSIHAVVVMTDGRDGDSQISLDSLKSQFSSREAPVKVFTVAYGENADSDILENIAEASQGSSAKGSEKEIIQVYQDMASFF